MDQIPHIMCAVSAIYWNYYHQNIVAFGDCLHKIHPLAGEGFNMTIRDIKVISKIIDALTTKRKVPNGRINNETILLRTF